MTCRSRLAFVALGLALVAGRAEAQDTLQLEPSTPGQRTHIVQTGETLWTLADRYMGDPLLWPAIYRLNTMVVEDPHWIYPGEELLLGDPTQMAMVEAPDARSDTLGLLDPSLAADTIGRAPEDTAGLEQPEDLPPPPPAPGEEVPTVFAPSRTGSRNIFVGRVLTPEYRAVVPATFYGAGFLTEGDQLPWARVVGAADKAMLGNLSSVSSARIFESIEIEIPSGASYHIGDSLLVAERGREVPQWGQIIEPTAIARVREVSGRRVVADVLSQWSRVNSNQVAMPVEPFRTPVGRPPVPIENGVTGRIITPREQQPITNARQVVFIDLGREHGVALGDVFEVLRPRVADASPEAPLQQVALFQVVHVRQRSASGLLIQIADLGVAAGSPVRLIRKMPS